MSHKNRQLLRICSVKNNDSDNDVLPQSQVTYLEDGDSGVRDIPRINPYGTHGVPPKESLGVILQILGDETQNVYIPISGENRPKGLKDGEFSCGNFVIGSIITFLENGDIIITGKNNIIANTTGSVTINSNGVNINSDVSINGDLNVSGTVEAGTIDNGSGVDLNTHIHDLDVPDNETEAPKTP